MRRSVKLLLACLLSLAGFGLVEGVAAAPALALCPIEGCDGGGGGGGGGGTPPTYGVVGEVTPISSASPGMVKFRGWSRFERNGVKIDANTLSVQCIAGTGQSDQDQENNAGFTDVEFWVGPVYAGGQIDVVCFHQATYAGVTYTAKSQVSVVAPL